jgi:hypothetical protein
MAKKQIPIFDTLSVLDIRGCNTVIPHKDCNLRCTFCNCEADHKKHKRQPEDTLDLVKYINKNVHSRVIGNILSLQFLGGELFQDKFTDEQIQYYYKFIDKVSNICDSKEKKIDLTITSNLVYKKINRLIDFIEYCKKKCHSVRFSTSYDFEGRFTKQYQIDLWYKNFAQLKSLGLVNRVTVVGHKRNLDIIQSMDGKFDSLYKITALDGVPLWISRYEDYNDLDFYRVPEKYWYEFLIWCFDHYPKVDNINNVINNIKHPWVRSLACWDEREDEFVYESIITNKNGISGCRYRNPKELAIQFITSHNCLSCDFFQKCGCYCPGDNTYETVCYKQQYLYTIRQKIKDAECQSVITM